MRPMFTQHKKKQGKNDFIDRDYDILLTLSTNTHYKKCQLLPHHVHNTQTKKKIIARDYYTVFAFSEKTHYQKGWIVATPHDQWSQHKQTKIKYSSRSRLLCSIRIQCDEQTSKVRIVATPYEQWSQHKKKQKNTFIARDFFTAFAFSATNNFQKVRIVATPYDHAHNHNK